MTTTDTDTTTCPLCDGEGGDCFRCDGEGVIDDSIVESPSGWSFRASQENGDQVDCRECGDPLDDDYPIVNDAKGYALHPACRPARKPHIVEVEFTADDEAAERLFDQIATLTHDSEGIIDPVVGLRPVVDDEDDG